jgi:hypothetical protein
MEMNIMKGSCLCKNVRFEIIKFSPHVSNGHCSMCRKFHGAAFATYGTVLEKDLTFTVESDSLKIYRSSDIAERGFCGNCGSSLFYKFLDARGTCDIALGTLDDEPNIPVEAHIYYANKPKWSGDFDDELPKFDAEHNLA